MNKNSAELQIQHTLNESLFLAKAFWPFPGVKLTLHQLANDSYKPKNTNNMIRMFMSYKNMTDIHPIVSRNF